MSQFREMKRLFVLILICVIANLACRQVKEDVRNKRIMLDQTGAERLIRLPLNCLKQEFPNKLNQTLGVIDEMGTPKELHPAFYGCFDWHSSVHGHWMLVRLLKLYPNMEGAEEARQILSEHLTREHITTELNYFQRSSESSFERTYGWAWLLKLAEELYTWEDTLAVELFVNLESLTQHIISAYLEYLPKLVYPIRTGEHSNTAFGMSFALDFARTTGNDTLESVIVQRALDFYLEDEYCPLSWEPGGHDFLSPCLEEMYLMKRVLESASFSLWGGEFLPELYKRDFQLTEGQVSDRTDGKLVHLDGLNFSRAWCMYGIAADDDQLEHLIHQANKHVKYSLDQIVDGSYSGEHWLATFAVYALTNDK